MHNVWWYTLVLIILSKSCLVSSQNCNPDVELKCPAKRYTYHVYHQTIKYTLPCPNSQITDMTWTLYNGNTKAVVDKFPDAKYVATLQAEKYASDDYELEILVVESNGGKTTKRCTFSYVSEPPVIIFTEGFMQEVPDDDEYVVDATPSKSYDGKDFPEITWTVKCIINRKLKECKDKPCELDGNPGMIITEISDKCYKSKSFKATVMHDGNEISKTHRVIIRPPYDCEVTIMCEKNCNLVGPMQSNPEISIDYHLEKMNQYCRKFQKWLPEWSLIDVKGNEIHKDKLEISSYNKRMSIPANTLGYSQRIAVRALVPDEFIAWEEIETLPSTVGPECKITPASGISIETTFSVRCTLSDEYMRTNAPFLKVYQIKDGQKILITSSADMEFDMVLPAIPDQPLQQLEIEGYDLTQNSFPCKSNPVEVQEIELTPEKVKILKKLIEQATQFRDPMAIQYMNAFLQALEQSDMDEKTKQAHKISVMEQLTAFEIYSADIYEKVAAMLPIFLEQEKITESYKTTLGSYCKQMAATYNKELSKSKYVKYNEMNAKQEAERNSKCAEKLLENAEEDEPEDEDEDITTTTELVRENMNDSAVTEKYLDYALPYKSPGEAKPKKDAVDITRDSALAVAQTLNKGENYSMSTNLSNTQITKDESQEFATKRMKFGDVTIVPSKSFEESHEDEVVAIFSNFDKEAMMPTSNLSGDIVDVHFHKNNMHFKTAGYNLEFKVTDEPPEFIPYQVKPPRAQNWRDIDFSMNVHRVNLKRLETCVIVFQFNSSNVKLHIAMSINERPRMRHFEAEFSNTIVDTNKPETFLVENPYPQNEGDCFFYMAVTPHVDMLRNSNATIHYEIQVSAVSCVTYNWTIHSWSPSILCKTGVVIPNSTRIVQCECQHTSLHSIYYKPIDHRLEEAYQLEFEMVDFFNYIIFTHVILVLAVYMLALASSMRRALRVFGRDKIFFLADNLKNDRYCYMLIVKTGSFHDAGTTANIMMQLYGQNGKSKPHVLNYPDPGCQLLQRDGIDWLILAHSSHLGSIDSVLIWTDSIGLYPTWYCDSVTVIDLQTEEKYYFEVHTWFSVLKTHMHFEKFKRTEIIRKVNSLAVSITKYFRLYYDGRHTWNIFKRDDEDLTFLERITVLLSMIYSCYVLNIFLTRPPGLRLSDSFGFGRFKFTMRLVYSSILSSFINSAVHLTIVFFLRNSNQVEKAGVMVVISKYFPVIIRNIIMYSLVIWISLCFTYLVVFGFWLPPQTAYIWCCITVTSLLISIILWENIFISLQNIICSKLGITKELIYRYDAIVDEIENQREMLFRIFGEVLLRPYFKKHYRLLTVNERTELREIILLRQDVASLFKDMCLFLVYIGILYVICIVQYNDETNRSNKILRMMLAESIYADGENKLEDINSIPEIYDYLEYVILPLIHPDVWYDKWYSVDAGVMADFCTKVLGIVQLRQQRRTQNCPIPAELGAQRILCTNKAPVFDSMAYYRSDDITPAFGLLEIYNGSGYIVPLGRTLKNSQFIMDILRRYKWIDINTKVLFIEFLTYNANANIFNAVRIIIERSPAARIMKSIQIYTVSLLYVSIYKELLSGFLLAMLMTVIIIMIIKRIVHILMYRHSYFKDFWNLIDILLTSLSIVLITLFFKRKDKAHELLEQIAVTDNNKFVNYFHLMTLAQTTTIIYGVTIALATIRLWKFLHFGLIFRIMERTILKAGPQLIGLLIYQVSIHLMVAIFLCPLYGMTVENFRSFDVASVNLFLSSINFNKHVHKVPLLLETINLYIMYALFLIISLCFRKLYATALILSLEDSKIYYSNSTLNYSIKNYVGDVSRYYKEKLKRHLIGTRLRAGGLSETIDVNLSNFITDKADNHRYADMVSLNKTKMEIMRFTCMAAIRKMQRFEGRSNLTEKDFTIMAILTYYLFHSEETKDELPTHVCFVMRDPTTGFYKFIPDRRLIQMKMVINKLLAGKIDDIDFGQSEVIVHENSSSRRLQILRENVDLMCKILNHIVIKGPEPHHQSIQSNMQM